MRQVIIVIVLSTLPLFAKDLATKLRYFPAHKDSAVLQKIFQEKKFGEISDYFLVRHILIGQKLSEYFRRCPPSLLDGCEGTADLISCLEERITRIDASNPDCGGDLARNARTLKLINGEQETRPALRQGTAAR